MNSYKGITRKDNPQLWGYIDTYRNIARDNYEEFLDSDVPIQRLVKKHYIKINLLKTTFNLSVYVMFYGIYISMKG